MTTKKDPSLDVKVDPTVELNEIVSMIGPKIAGLRKAQGLSLQQLATASDVSAAAIHKIERSGMVPTITTLLKLAGALGVPAPRQEPRGEDQSGGGIGGDGRAKGDPPGQAG